MQSGFEPAALLPALAGGMLIGLAVALMAVACGRVTGVSGILSGVLRPAPGDWIWRLAFVAGIVAAPLAWTLITGVGGQHAATIDTGPLAPLPVLALAGLVTGVGAGMGSGCTSGHGVCGLARGSRRSFIATLVFMTAAAATVFAIRHLLAA